MTPTCTPNGLRDLRLRANLSQESLAKRLGWSQSRVGRIEGILVRELKLGDADDYCRALGLEFHFAIAEPERMPCGAKV
jgi:transcriptional regulator with XRE-family HTH domain